jgi:hypothetical protein
MEPNLRHGESSVLLSNGLEGWPSTQTLQAKQLQVISTGISLYEYYGSARIAQLPFAVLAPGDRQEAASTEVLRQLNWAPYNIIDQAGK